MRIARSSAAAVAAGAVLAFAGCDSMMSPAPTSHCTEAGAQCALPDGPLGVCERSSCGAGASPPCFACTPQH